MFVCMNECPYMCTMMRFFLHRPGPGYWLLSRQVVPPPQSDHWKQLLSGESTQPIRHKKGHNNIIRTNTVEQNVTQIQVWWLYKIRDLESFLSMKDGKLIKTVVDDGRLESQSLFPLHCPGPGYWLLSRREVPPPQSDLWKQLLSGEYLHAIRFKKYECRLTHRDNT